MVALNYDMPEDLHQRMKLAATYKGQSIKTWLMRTIEAEVERQEVERAEAERKRRGR